MARLPRLLVVLLLCAVAGERATAQFRRGILAESAEIQLLPAVPPSLLLPAGTFQVDVRNQSTGPARLLSRLDEAITRQLEEKRQPAATRHRHARHDHRGDAHRVDAQPPQWHEVRVRDAPGGHQAGHRFTQQFVCPRPPESTLSAIWVTRNLHDGNYGDIGLG